MMTSQLAEIFKKAAKFIENPDVIIDVYDMTYAWVSDYHCQISEYSEAEQVGEPIAKISQLEEGDTSKIAPEVTMPNKKFVRQMIITTKSGQQKSAQVEGVVLEIAGQPYLVGKIIQI